MYIYEEVLNIYLRLQKTTLCEKWENQIENKVWLKETGCMSKSHDWGLNVGRNITFSKIRCCGKWKFKIERLTPFSFKRCHLQSLLLMIVFITFLKMQDKQKIQSTCMFIYCTCGWVVHCKMGSWNLQHHSINACMQYSEEVLEGWPLSKPLIVCRYTDCIFSYGNYYYYGRSDIKSHRRGG